MVKVTSIPYPTVQHQWRTVMGHWTLPWLSAQGKQTRKVRQLKKVFFYAVQKPIMVLAFAVTALVTPILGAIDLGKALKAQHSRKTTYLDGGCDNFFGPNVFHGYQAQLHNKMKESLAFHDELSKSVGQSKSEGRNAAVTAFAALVGTIERGASEELKSIGKCRAWFRQVTRDLRSVSLQLRAADANDPLVKQAKECLEHFNYERYFQVDLKPLISDLLHKRESAFGVAHGGDFLQKLTAIDKALQKNGKLTHDGCVEEFFDAHFFGNIPFGITTVPLSDGHQVRFTRMPSITKDTHRDAQGHTDAVEIIEEMQLFKDHLKRKGHKHLYVNLMSRKYGNEAIRSQKIEELDREAGTPFAVITLDKDSHFYEQKGEFSTFETKAADFKKLFLERMFDPDGLYSLTTQMEPKVLKDECVQMMDKIHRENFGGRDDLTQPERRDFIELVYLALIDYVLEELKPNSTNISCKHCIDRGATQNMAYIYAKTCKPGEIMSQECDEAFRTLIFGPAVMVSNRAPLAPRVERILAMLRRRQS